MSAVNTVNNVDAVIETYANDNVKNTEVNDYNNYVTETFESIVAPRKSLADIAGLAINDNK